MDKIDLKINLFLGEAKKRACPEKCVLCKKKVKKLCNSHSVPKTILGNLAKEGWILKADAIAAPSPKTEQGDLIKRAGTFSLICYDCDNMYFKHYENLKDLHSRPTDIILAEIALKNSLLQLYKTKVEIEFIEILKENGNNKLQLDARLKVLNLDESLFSEEVKRYSSLIKNGAEGEFKILYWALLPYKTPMAAQGHIPLAKDISGNTVNDNFNYSVTTQSMHVGVFPFKEKETIVLAFYHRDDKKYRSLYHQMRSASNDTCLQFINYTILEHTENCFFAKEILGVLHNDSGIRAVVREDNGLPDFGWMVDSWETLNFVRARYQSPSLDTITNLLSKEFALL